MTAPDDHDLRRQAEIEARALGDVSVGNYAYLSQRTDITPLHKGDYMYEGRMEPTEATVEEAPIPHPAHELLQEVHAGIGNGGLLRALRMCGMDRAAADDLVNRVHLYCRPTTPTSEAAT